MLFVLKRYTQRGELQRENESAPTKGEEPDLAAPENNALFWMNWIWYVVCFYS